VEVLHHVAALQAAGAAQVGLVAALQAGGGAAQVDLVVGLQVEGAVLLDRVL